MKGKGRSYTYWLETGTEYNDAANPEKIKQVQKQVKTVLSKKKWFKRRYFGFSRRSSGLGSIDPDGHFLMSNDDASTIAPSVDLLGLDEGSTATGDITSTLENTPVQTEEASTVTSRSSKGKTQDSEHDQHSYTEVNMF